MTVVIPATDSSPQAQGNSSTQTGPQERRLIAVKWWAGLGVVIAAFIAYVLIDWVSGPFLEPVPTGQTDPPTYMKIAMVVFQAVSIPVGLGLIGWFAVRPIIRQRRSPLTECWS